MISILRLKKVIILISWLLRVKPELPMCPTLELAYSRLCKA